MPTDAQLPKPEKPAIWSMLAPAVVAILLIVALPKSFYWHPAFLAPGRNVAFRMENGAWLRLPELPGDPEELRVSTAGTVWATVSRYGEPDELARLDGSVWRLYGPAEFGECGVDTSAGLALDGEEVWAAGYGGVLHWDGAHWKCYREAAGKAMASAIVAASGQVWLIDSGGNLSHFDGNQWKTAKVELPGVKWGDRDTYAPELARTDDGSLWILENGLWRSDGTGWMPVKRGGEDFEDAALVGSGSDGIWLWANERLQLVGPAGILGEFQPEEMGFRPGEAMNQAARTGGHTYVATSLGILEFDGANWRRLPPLGSGVRAVEAIRAGAHGELLAVGNIPNPTGLRWGFLRPAMPLVLALALLAMPVWMVRNYKRSRLSDHVRLQQAVAHATGAVPEEFARDERLLARQSSWWSATVTVGVIVGAMVAYSITRMFWPAVPPWMFLAITLGLHAVVTLGQTLVKRTPKPWDPIEPGGPGFDWGPTRRAVPASLVVFTFMNVGAFPKWMGDPFVWLLCGLSLAMWFRVAGEKLRVRVLRRGDYDGALKLVRRFRFYNPEGGHALLWRGHVLVLAGRFREAEETLRAAVARLRSRTAQAHALEFLGDALMGQGRFDEAQRSYEAALHAVPGFRRPYRGMAEVALQRGGDAARALEYVENILGPTGLSWNQWVNARHSKDDYWSLKAWALAELGRGAEAATAAGEAIRRTNPKSRPDLATTCRRLGMAMKALGRQAEAEEYFKRARDADPHGRWSAQVGAMLGEKSAWRA